MAQFFVGSGSKMTWKGRFQIGINHFGCTALHLIWSERWIFLPDVQLPIIGNDHYFIVYKYISYRLRICSVGLKIRPLPLCYYSICLWKVIQYLPRWYFCFYHFVIIIWTMRVHLYLIFTFFREWRTGILWNILTTILINHDSRCDISFFKICLRCCF
jgi:hypothetical protein